MFLLPGNLLFFDYARRFLLGFFYRTRLLLDDLFSDWLFLCLLHCFLFSRFLLCNSIRLFLGGLLF